MTTFPIAHEEQWSEVGPMGQDFHIHPVGHITSQGQLWLQVTTSTNSWGLGFTGGVSALALGQDGTVLWSSRLYNAGVDAKSVFWSRSTRVDTYFDEWVPADVLPQVTELKFLMAHTPHDRWFEDWNKVRTGLGAVIKTVTDVIAAIPPDWIKPKVA